MVKKKLTVLITFLLFTVATIFLWQKFQTSSEAAWFDDTWSYRQNIVITNNGSASTNTQIQVVVGTGDLINTGKMRTDCGDIRFTDLSGNILKHWNEYCRSTSSKNSSIWVTIPSLPAGSYTIYMYYGNPNANNTSTFTALPTGLNIGDGNDSTLTVSGTINLNSWASAGRSSVADAINPAVTALTPAGSNTVTATSSSGFAVGDEILLINLQGASGASATAVGQYETARITSINSNTLTLNHPLIYNYDGSTKKVMVQRVPNYTTVTVNNAAILTASSWSNANGTGGTLMFRSSSGVTLNGTGAITTTGLGYVGGTGGGNSVGGNTGESYDGAASGRGGNVGSYGESRGGGRSGNGAAASPTASPADGAATGAGGGGGSDGSTNTTLGGGGAGGGGGHAGGGGGGGGNMDRSTTARDQNGGAGGTAGAVGVNAGGGGGSCLDTATTGTAGRAGGAANAAGTGTGCNTTGSGGGAGSGATQGSGGGGSTSAGSGAGGGGGGYYGAANLSSIYFGSGGGGGGGAASGGSGTAGGNGGGIIYIAASSLSLNITSTITASGSAATAASAGGGSGGAGAGGSIFLNVPTVSQIGTQQIAAMGGSRGTVATGVAAGGAGGDGRIHINYSTVTGTTNPTYDASTLPVAGSPASEEQSTGPVAYWKFDEGTGTAINDSIATGSGTITNATWQNEDLCLSGKCLYFNGTTAYASVPLPVKNVKTINFWIKPSTTTAALIDLNEANTITATNSAITANGFSSPTIYVNGVPGSTLTANTWQMITVTTNTAINASIIKFGNIGAGYTNGFMDEVKMYNYVLTTTQIKSLYSARGNRQGSSFITKANPNATGPVSNGLVGYWRMDETSGNALDSSGNSNTAVPTGTTIVTGKFGSGRQTTASSNYLTVTSASSLNFTNQMSASAWIYLTSYPSSGLGRIFGRSDSSFELAIDSSGTSICGQGKISVYTPGLTSWQCTNYLLSLSTWYHISSTFDGKNLRVYVNDSLIWTSSPSTINIGGNLLIGAAQGGSEGFPGTLDEARVYNRSLTATEVSQLYNWAPGPVAYYNFEEGISTVTKDISGNNNSGTITGATWSTGKYGKSLYFNGVSTTNVTTADRDYLDFTYNTPFSIGAWIKSPGSVDFKTIISKTLTATPYSGYLLRLNTTNNLEFILLKTDVGSKYLYVTSTAISDNVWHYVFVNYDGSGSASGVNIYVDGTKQSTTTVFDALESGNLVNTEPLIIGAQNASPTAPFLGNIDEVKIYNYVRNQRQIVEDMNAGHPVPGSPVGSPTLWYKFDEGYFTSVLSDSGSSKTNSAAVNSFVARKDGKFGSGVRSTATNSYITVGDVSWVDGINGMTIGMWLNPTTLATSKEIINKAAGNQHNFRVITDSSSSSNIRVCIASILTDASGGCANYYTTSGLGLTAGTWQYLTIVYDGTQSSTSRVKVYKNGTLISGSYTGTIPANLTSGSTSNLKIGIADDSANQSIEASYDELKIYLFPLIQDQIRLEYYNNGQVVSLGQLTINPNASNSASSVLCPPGDTSCAEPIHWWKLDENSGFCVGDYGTGNINGAFGANVPVNCKTQSAGANDPAWTPGKIGTGLYFGGDDIVTMNTVLGLNGATKATWMGWFRRQAVSGTVAIGDQNSCTNGVTIEIVGTDMGATIGNPLGGCTAGNVTLNDTNWHHFVSVYDGTLSGNAQRHKIYIDGLQRTVSYSLFGGAGGVGDSINDTGGSFVLGDCGVACGAISTGKMDDIRFYNYVRSPAQIAWDYNRGLPVTWWKFNECQGTTANDSVGTVSGTLNSGTAGNCTTTSTAWFNGATGKFNSGASFGSAPNFTTATSNSTYPFFLVANSQSSWGGWFKPTSSINDQGLMDKDNNFRLYTDGSGNAICSIYYSAAYHDATTVTAPLTLNSWNHVICTYDGANIKTYVNGVLKNTTADSNGISVATSTFRVGQISGGTPKQFTGIADDVKLWNYPLNLTQVKLDYNQSSAVRFGPSTGSP